MVKKKSKKGYEWIKGPLILVATIVAISLAVNLLMQAPQTSTTTQHHPEYKSLNEGTNPGAPVTLVEFIDVQCPFCAQFHESVAQLQKDFGKDLNYVIKHAPNQRNHKHAVQSAAAVICADQQGAANEYLDIAFANQDKLDMFSLQQYAQHLDLDPVVFSRCLQDNATAQQIQDDLFEAQAINLRGTPTIFINGAKLEGAHDYSKLRQLIEAIIEKHYAQQN